MNKFDIEEMGIKYIQWFILIMFAAIVILGVIGTIYHLVGAIML